MNILFISHIPLDFENSNIYSDLLYRLSKDNNVTIISDITKFPPVEKRLECIQVKWAPFRYKNPYLKGILTFLGDYILKRMLRKINLKEIDIVLYPTPPIFYTSTLKYIKRNSTAIRFLILKDIFPQNAVDEKYLKKDRILHKIFRKKEIMLYSLSNYIGCMSKGNVSYIRDHNPEVDYNKVIVFPNSRERISPNYYTRHDNKNWRDKLQIPLNKKIFVFGGNISLAQGISNLVASIMAVEDIDAHFVIVGEGVLYNYVETELSNKKNVSVIKKLPVNEFDSLVASSNVGIVSIADFYTIPNYPSRLLTYMRLGIPVLALTDDCSDIKELLIENKFGKWSKSGDIIEFKKNITFFVNCDNECKFMGENSLKYFEKFFTVDVSINIINKIMEENKND